MAPVTCGTGQDYMFNVTKMTVTCWRFARGIFQQLTSSMLLIGFTDRRIIGEVPEEHFKHFFHFLTSSGQHVLIMLCLTASTSSRLWPCRDARSQWGGFNHGNNKHLMACQQNRQQPMIKSYLMINVFQMCLKYSFSTTLSSSVNPDMSRLSELQVKKFLAARLISAKDIHGGVSHRLMLDSSTI